MYLEYLHKACGQLWIHRKGNLWHSFMDKRKYSSNYFHVLCETYSSHTFEEDYAKQ